MSDADRKRKRPDSPSDDVPEFDLDGSTYKSSVPSRSSGVCKRLVRWRLPPASTHSFESSSAARTAAWTRLPMPGAPRRSQLSSPGMVCEIHETFSEDVFVKSPAGANAAASEEQSMFF